MCIYIYLFSQVKMRFVIQRVQQAEVTVEGKAFVGGIAGEAGLVENCVNKGKVISNGTVIRVDSAVSNTGGVVGFCDGINHCKNYGEITVNSTGLYVGGVAGHLEGTYTRIEGVEWLALSSKKIIQYVCNNWIIPNNKKTQL